MLSRVVSNSWPQAVLSPQPLKALDYRHEPPHLAQWFFIVKIKDGFPGLAFKAHDQGVICKFEFQCFHSRHQPCTPACCLSPVLKPSLRAALRIYTFSSLHRLCLCSYLHLGHILRLCSYLHLGYGLRLCSYLHLGHHRHTSASLNLLHPSRLEILTSFTRSPLWHPS